MCFRCFRLRLEAHRALRVTGATLVETPNCDERYVGVNNPLQEDDDGNMLAPGNVFTQTNGSKTSSGTGFMPPYQLTPDATGGLEATLRAQIGPR